MNNRLQGRRAAVIGAFALLIIVLTWFSVPRMIYTAAESFRNVKKNYPPTVLSGDIRTRIEKELREIIMSVRTGDKKGEENFSNHYLALGLDYETLGSLDFAESAYHLAINEDTKNYLPYENLGTLYAARGDYAPATEAFQKAIELNPGEFSTYVKLAENYWYKGADFDAARGTYLDGIMKTGNNESLVRAFASFLEQSGEFHEALLYYTALAQKHPTDAELKKHVEDLKGKK